MAELSIKQKQEWAQQLYCDGGTTQKAIANKVGISEKTMSKWVDKYNWETLRKSLLITKQEQLSRLYDQLDNITTEIRDRDTGKNYATPAEADTIVKLTKAIEQLEEETNMADVFEIGKQFITFIQQVDFEKSKEIVDLYDGFIKHKLKAS